MSRPLSSIAAHVGGQIEGDQTLIIERVAGLDQAGPRDLSFFGDLRYREAFEQSKAGAVLVSGEAPKRSGLTVVKVPNAHLAFARASQLLNPRPTYAPGISPSAAVHSEANVDSTVTVMSLVSVGRGARIGARTVIHPGCVIGDRAVVGDDTILYPNVTVYDGCEVGSRCVLHASSVVGADGFGFALDMEKPEHVKIPQTGIARLEDDVELGACSCVDRATTGETVIGRGTKIDNLVQVAHNVRVGPFSILCSQAGISGSTTLGHGVMLGGQVGVSGHLKIGDMVKVVAQSGIAQDVEAGAVIAGAPAVEAGLWKRASLAWARVPDLLKEFKKLQRRVEALEQGKPR